MYIRSMTSSLHKSDYIPRKLKKELKTVLHEYPVISILGPRQSGKTTFVLHECKDFNYANLEDPETRILAEQDPKAFFDSFSFPLIIDEVQRVPSLLSYIQIIVDREKQNGLFVLTGSHQLALGEAIAQSLAGRTAILTLLPFSIEELEETVSDFSREKLLFLGFLPCIYDQRQEANRAYRNYFQTYVERDLRSIMRIKDLSKFEIFLRLMAGRVGQLFSASSLASEVGVSYKTVQEWISILEASFIIFKLPPWYKNYGKRLIKSPKYYFVEPGLAVYLLGIEKEDQVFRDPLFGNLFENMLVCELLKARLNRGKEAHLYFYRDSNGFELDIIYDKPEGFIPAEIKSAMTWNLNLAKNLISFKKQNPKIKKSYLLYAGDLQVKTDEYQTIHYKKAYTLFDE